jgi:hypothetical protein
MRWQVDWATLRAAAADEPTLQAALGSTHAAWLGNWCHAAWRVRVHLRFRPATRRADGAGRVVVGFDWLPRSATTNWHWNLVFGGWPEATGEGRQPTGSDAGTKVWGLTLELSGRKRLGPRWGW